MRILELLSLFPLGEKLTGVPGAGSAAISVIRKL
jgi:hypothetical protein